MRKKLIAAVLAWTIAFIVAIYASAAGQPAPPFNYYFGNLHAHTSYSDGMGTPSEAYAQVIEKGNMDFFSLTEHGYYFQEKTNIHLWYKSFEEANAFYKPGNFVSLVGFEWTHSEGHMNGYATAKAGSRDTQRDFASYIEFLHEQGGFASFNHPNPEFQPNWNDFSYWKRADDVVTMIEVGAGAYYRNIRYEPSYIKALDRGWKVGAVNNQDNHKNDWGTAAPVRTGIVAKELTRESVLDAMRSMMTYSTEDRNARALIWTGETLMGQTLTVEGGAAGKQFQINIYAEDPDGDLFTKIELVTNGGKVAATYYNHKGGVIDATVKAEHDYSYFYARLLEADGDRIVTSPIWVESPGGLVASDFDVEDTFIIKGKPASFYARVADRSGECPPETPYALLADYGEGYLKIAEGTLMIPAGRWTHLTVPFIPRSQGKVSLKLVLADGAIRQEFQCGEYEVMDKQPGRFVVDEGHNNRLTSYYKGLLSIGKQNGYEGGILEESITSKTLAELELLIIPMPEQGFSLTPTYFEEEELAAIASWVESGGSLMLVGWGELGDGTRDPKNLNALCAALGLGARFGTDMLKSGDAVASSVALSTPSGKYLVAFTEGSSIIKLENGAAPLFVTGAEGLIAVDAEGKSILNPAFIAGFVIGKGRALLAGSVLFSDYELSKSGFDNAKLASAMLRWLLEGRW